MTAVSTAIRKLKMRKFGKTKGCTPRVIKFKMKGGRTKKFVGRPGGAGKNGICGAPTPAVRAARSAFRRAVKGCPKTNGQKKFSCIKRKLKAA